jgi:hypothetical protein
MTLIQNEILQALAPKPGALGFFFFDLRAALLT